MNTKKKIGFPALERHYFQEPDGLDFPLFVKFPAEQNLDGWEMCV